MADPAASKQSGPDGTGTGRSGRGVRSPSRSRLSTDVPEAVRDRPGVTPSSSRRGGGLWIVLAVLILLGAIAGWGVTTGQFQAWLPGATEPVVEEVTDPAASPTVSADDLLGHLPYEEAPEDELVAISADGRFQMRESAAESYTRMAEEARRAGIPLVVLSAFRSIELQQQIFFDVKANRRQTPDERAEVSAPPGYSEHHTGYAIDFGDGEVPSTHLREAFEETRTFEWLEQNAVRFNFELSFPRGNVQGIAYEPWHWRFVGDRDSLETFYKARYQVKPRPTPLDRDREGADDDSGN